MVEINQLIISLNILMMMLLDQMYKTSLNYWTCSCFDNNNDNNNNNNNNKICLSRLLIIHY